MRRSDRSEYGTALVAMALIGLAAAGWLEPVLGTIAGDAGRPLRCGNRVCNLREDALTCRADCGCSVQGEPGKPWLGTNGCCPGYGMTNGVCCPLGNIWTSSGCAPTVAQTGSSQRVDCTAELRQQGYGGGWLSCPRVYAPVCTFDANGRVIATLRSDCMACADNAVAYFIRGTCPS